MLTKILYSGYVNSPVPKKGSGKYGGGRLLGKNPFDGMCLSKEARDSLSNIGNHGLSKSTWSNYRTAERMLRKCEKQLKRKMELPLSQENTLVWIDWLIRCRGVRHGTVTNYLAGIRQLHVVKGLQAPVVRTDLVNLILARKKNMDRLEKNKGEGSRLPVTYSVMRLLKAALRDSDMEKQEKLLIWAVCCLAFNGVFRIHELLSKEEGEFDPDFTLLEENLVWLEEENIILVRLKWPKEDKKGSEFEVEVFETGGEFCPVKALRRWRLQEPPRDKGLPAFRLPSGKALTGRRFNKCIRQLLSPFLDYKAGKITAHSFMAGVPSLLAAAGFSDEEIKAVGRWSSRAFERYVKLPRTRRRQMAMTISSMQCRIQ